MQSEQRANYELDGHLPMMKTTSLTRPALLERRSKPRSTNPLPARVWGVDIDDQPFGFDCLLDNMSASGLYLHIPRRMRFSSAINLVVRLLNGPSVSAAIRGTVLRDEPRPDGRRGVAVRIVEHNFI